MMISHARKGTTRNEQRWRKSHGLLFWVLLPGVAGLLTVLGMIKVLPRSFSMLSRAPFRCSGRAAEFQLPFSHLDQFPL